MGFYYFNDAADSHAEAIRKAKAEHPSMQFDGCFWCCRACHRG